MTVRSQAERAVIRLLERQGTVSEGEAGRLTELAASCDLSIHELLEREGVLTETALAELLAKTLRLRFVDRASVQTDPAAAELVGEAAATQYGVVPVGIDGAILEVATANPLDLAALKAIEFKTGRRVRFVVTTRTEIAGDSSPDAPSPAPPAFEPPTFEPPTPPIVPESTEPPVMVILPEPEDAPAEENAVEPPETSSSEVTWPVALASAESSEAVPAEPPEEPPADDRPETVPWPDESAAASSTALSDPARDERCEQVSLAVEPAALPGPPTDELRAMLDELRDDQQALAAETRAAVAATRLTAEHALDRALAAVDALREQLADLRREQGEQVRAAREAGAESARARQAVADALERIGDAAHPPAAIVEVRTAVVGLGAELAHLRAIVEDTVVPRLAAAEGAIPDVELLRKTVDELARPLDTEHDVAARAAADAARAMEHAEKALRRVADATLPLGEELGVLRAAYGELRAGHARLESAVERRADETERRSAALIASRIEEITRWHEAQRVAAGNAGIEAAVTRQQANEALRRVEAIAVGPSADDLRALRNELDTLREEHRRRAASVEERTEARVRTTAESFGAGVRELRRELEQLRSGLQELVEQVGWLERLRPLRDRLMALSALPSRLLGQLVPW